MQIKESTFSVFIKPNSHKNELTGYDPVRNAYIISIKEPAENNKANLELLKFLRKMLKRNALIISGHRSRLKRIKIEEQNI